MAIVGSDDDDGRAPVGDEASARSLGDDCTGSGSGDDDTLNAVRGRRRVRNKHAVRVVSLVSATATALCAGSIVVFSLYAPLFQSRLRYSQFQVNGVAIGGSLAMYLPISVVGYVCDRVGVAPLALLSSLLFGAGYGLAAAIYRMLDLEYNGPGRRSHVPAGDWFYLLMVLAFVCVGSGTCTMYMAAVSTCAKNFGKGRYCGLALALPITAFGLSSMWLSQVVSRFCETDPDGSRGDVDVFRFFLFLAALLVAVGLVATFTLRVVDEQHLIDEAIEELETSGVLDGSALLGYADRDFAAPGPASLARDHDEDVPLLGPSKDGDARWKKNWVLNAETRRFLTDHIMWPFALAFLLMVGLGEAFNNLGTVIRSLTPLAPWAGAHTSAATYVSVFGVTSAVARLLMGTLTDLVAPAPETQHVQVAPGRGHRPVAPTRFAVSRVVFMLVFGVLMSAGLVFLASGAAQEHAERFWVMSGLVGAGYGAVFSLTPLIVTII